LDPSNRAAAEFFELLLSPESQAELAGLGAIPALSASAATAPGSQVSIQDELILQAMVALEDGATYPVLPEMEFYPPSMDIALQSIFIDGQPQQAALDTAETAIRDAVASYKSTADQNP
jgi:maltose-binding protein MalE